MKTINVNFAKKTNNGLIEAPVSEELIVGEVVKLAQEGDKSLVFGAVVVSVNLNSAIFQIAWDGKKNRR